MKQNAIGDSIRWDFFRRTGQARCRREEVRYVQDIVWILPGFDHARPPGHCRNADTAFQHVALGTPEKRVSGCRPERRRTWQR